jgi:hypothetical protein
MEHQVQYVQHIFRWWWRWCILAPQVVLEELVAVEQVGDGGSDPGIAGTANTGGGGGGTEQVPSGDWRFRNRNH